MRISKMKLAMAMVTNGYNFKQLSEKTKISRATLSYINNGKNCRPDILFKIAKDLNVTPEYLTEEVSR